jgi:hypothetical protein
VSPCPALAPTRPSCVFHCKEQPENNGTEPASVSYSYGLMKRDPRTGPEARRWRLRARNKKPATVSRPSQAGIVLVTLKFKRQSEVYMAAAMARDCPVRFVPMPGTSHYDIVFGLAKRESPLAHAVIETMGLA